MLDLGWQELFFITLIAIIIVGPKDLPMVMRSLSRWLFRTKSIARDFQHSLEESIKEAGIDEVNKDLAMVVKETESAVLNENDHYSDLASSLESFENQSLKKNKT